MGKKYLICTDMKFSPTCLSPPFTSSFSPVLHLCFLYFISQSLELKEEITILLSIPIIHSTSLERIILFPMWTSSMPFELSCSHAIVSQECIRIKASQQCLACSGSHHFVPHLFRVVDGILFLPEFLMKQPLFSSRLIYGILLFGALRQRYDILNDKQRSTSFPNIALSTDWKESDEGGLGKGWDNEEVGEEGGVACQRDAG